MESLSQQFSQISGELCNLLYLKHYNKSQVNSLIDELNSKPFKRELFVRKHDASALLTALCLNIKPGDEFISAKTSHLINSVIIKQNIQFPTDFLWKVVSWHIECLIRCSDIILPDILHNLQCILQSSPQCGHKFTEQLIGNQGILLKLLDTDKAPKLNTKNPLQITLIALKCIAILVAIPDSGLDTSEDFLRPEVKKQVSQIVVSILLSGSSKAQDDFLYCKLVISALRVLSQLYYNDPNTEIPMPEVMGICVYFTLYGLVYLGHKPERIMPSQQTIAVTPVVRNTKGGKKQKLRKQRNSAIENLKKEIPVTDRSLLRDVDSFENNSAYKPASRNYLEPTRVKNSWVLTSDSDMSDVETGEAKLIALKSRVRQSASNLLLVLVKERERKEMIGYWWALLPDSPDPGNWLVEEAAKKTLAYCAVADPVAGSRTSALSVVLALLSGSRIYLSQAETSKKDTASFIPFSVSLGYMTTCMHYILSGILDAERSDAVVMVALKCCAALVQATPYHKMQDGLITGLVKSTRRFLVHKDIQLQVGALITMGCILSVDTKKDEVLKSIEKDTAPLVTSQTNAIGSDCDDFEEGYSDDEMFTAEQSDCDKAKKGRYFKSWILDICFKNMGWIFRGNEVHVCKPSVVPVILESLQVVSAIAFHHLGSLLYDHVTSLADTLHEMLQHEHQDVVLQAATTTSIVADAILNMEQTDSAPPLNQCVSMWEKLITPLSAVLQNHEYSPARAAVCDCIANVGDKSFKELPRRTQVLCCTLLVGSCSDAEASVRAAAVRALAMAVMFRTLREDIGFVSDCGENILRALAEPTLVVRTKAAWAFGNLSDALVLNMLDPQGEAIDDDLLLRLVAGGLQGAADNDKIKMSATRGLGNLLRLINTETLQRNPQLKPLCDTAIEKLLDCACKVSNMKVRWNACYAIGNAMKNAQLFTCFNGWQGQVFHKLCQLCQECKNVKVRITAATALRSPARRAHYARHYVAVWAAALAALDHAAHLDDYSEYRHKDNLIEQLCVTLAHLCCLLSPSDLADILDPLVFHQECARSQFVQVCRRLPPEDASCLRILQAAKYVTVDLTSENLAQTQAQALALLHDIFIWDV